MHPSNFYNFSVCHLFQLLRATVDNCTATVPSGTFHLICARGDRKVRLFLFVAKLCTFLARHSSLPAARSRGSLSACQHLELRSKPDADTAMCASAENLLRQFSQISASLTWRTGTRRAAALCERVFKWSMCSVPVRRSGQEDEGRRPAEHLNISGFQLRLS